MRKKAFLDIETTGLEPDKHEVWEVAVAIDDDPVQTYIVPHTLTTADPKALELNGYFNRGLLSPVVDLRSHDLHIRNLVSGCTVVAANPSFDVDFLYRRWGVAPWHHRKIDVETMAYTVLQYDEMKGMADISNDLHAMGFSIRQPDHTAYGDVVALRDCYKALRSLREIRPVR